MQSFIFYPISGKLAILKAIVVGTPTPTVTWSRANGEMLFHPSTYEPKYDEVSHEHTLEVSKIGGKGVRQL